MLYLILAIVSSSLVSVTMRVSEKYRKNNISMLAVNYVMCVAFSGLMALTGRQVLQPDGAPMAIGLGLLNGCLYLGAFVLLQWNITENGVGISSTFMKLGVLVPTLLTVIAFHEKPTVFQVSGVVLACAAIVLIQGKGGSRGEGKGWGLLLLLLIGGSTDAMSKVFEQVGSAAWSDVFLLITFASALVLCIITARMKGQGLAKEDILWGLLLGIPNTLSSKFLLISLSRVPAVIACPTYSVSTILLVNLTGVLVFREKCGTRRMIALAIILVAILLLNL